jgi:hypothetical protein
MKKILTIGLILFLVAGSATAQDFRHNYRDRFRDSRLTVPELRELQRDQFRYNMARRRAIQDGMVTPIERLRLHKMKAQNRREAFRFRHNRSCRLI